MYHKICFLATPEIVDQGESHGSHLWVPLYWDWDGNAEKCFKASCTSPGLPLMSKWFATSLRVATAVYKTTRLNCMTWIFSISLQHSEPRKKNVSPSYSIFRKKDEKHKLLHMAYHWYAIKFSRFAHHLR